MNKRLNLKVDFPPKSTGDVVGRKLDAVAKRLRQPTSIPVQVAAVLRGLILGGQLCPGDRVVEWKISRQLEIGQPTAREALLILEGEGLLLRNPNRGCTVTSLSVKEIGQIYAVRVELEPLAAELAVRNRENWNPDVLTLAIERLSKAAASGDLDAWHKSDLEFHQTLWQIAGNPFLEKSLSQICIPFFAFSELVYLHDKPRNLKSLCKQHANIATAIVSGSEQQARLVTRKVLEDFRKNWVSSTEQAADELKGV